MTTLSGCKATHPASKLQVPPASAAADHAPPHSDPTRPAAAADLALLLCRNTRKLVGREREVETVLGSLRSHGAAVIWGSPGEGKTAIAAEAGSCLQEDSSANIRLSVVLDMHGAHTCPLRSYRDAIGCGLPACSHVF